MRPHGVCRWGGQLPIGLGHTGKGPRGERVLHGARGG
jgi:hypothetical protein